MESVSDNLQVEGEVSLSYLVDEEHGLAAVHRAVPPGRLDDRADLLHPRVDRRQLGERAAGRRGDQVGQRGLARPRRAPQHDRGRAGDPAVTGDQPTQRRPRHEQVVLPDHLGEGRRAVLAIQSESHGKEATCWPRQ